MASAESPSKSSANTINMLLMGETGVGKSTFINSFANYIKSNTFEEAAKNQVTMLIPTHITVFDENTQEDCNLTIGSDKNEKQEIGCSATQSVQNYIFPIEGANLMLRLIDTPGLGDTRGPDQDDQNCEGILEYLTQVDEIHAICLLMKPSNDRNTVLFSYCVRRILSQLHKSACNNVIFLFTNTKGSDYRAGATLPILKKMTDEIAADPPYARIPITKDNVFCLDNESFKHLLALRYGIELNERTRGSCQTSWKISSDEIKRFISYVKTLKPHNVKKTVSVNRTRDLILQLSKPLSEICQLLQENINILKQKEDESKKTDQTIEELKKTLYAPGLDLEVIKLDHSVTVCTNCAESVQVGRTRKDNYRQKCHDPCILGYISYEIIGHWSLATCSEMTWSFFPTCKHCKCSYKKHMTIYYDTKVVEKQMLDEEVQTNIESEEKQREKINQLIEEIKQEKKELEAEMEFVSQCAAKFAYFLQNNAITSSFDTFREYIYLSLQRQRSLGNKANMDLITSLTEILNRHEQLTSVLTNKKSFADGEKITEESIYEDAKELFKLKYAGAKIKEIFDAREACAKRGVKSKLKSIFTETIPNWFFNKHE